MKTRAARPLGFTLIELLVVIAIIALLAALVIPGLRNSMRKARVATCTSNIKQVSTAMNDFEAGNERVLWLDSGKYGPVTTPNGGTVNGYVGRSWSETLRYLKFLPNTPRDGVWKCPEVSTAEMDALDSNGWKANHGGYGVAANVLRYELTVSNAPNAPLRSGKIFRPSQTWLVGDCGLPGTDNVPGDGKYFRTAASWGRPSSKGVWSATSSQPALRHMKTARWAAWDGHVETMTWADMVAEKDNFTCRGETF